MNIRYQYYNEIVLAFADYEIDYREGIIVIEVPLSQKPFDSVCDKIEAQIQRIADSLDERDEAITVLVERGEESKTIVFEKLN